MAHLNTTIVDIEIRFDSGNNLSREETENI